MLRSFLAPLAFVTLVAAFGCTPPAATTEKPSDKPAATEDGKSTEAPPKEGTATKPKADDPSVGVVSGGNGESYTLRLKVTAGQSFEYPFTVNTSVDPRALPANDPKRKYTPDYATLQVAGTYKLTVDKVDGTTIHMTRTSTPTSAVGTGTWKAQADQMMKDGAQTQKFDWDDRLHTVNMKEDEAADPLTNTLNGVFPKDPVKVGSTWKYKPFANATELTTAKVEKLEEVQGRQTLKLSIKTPSANPNETMDFFVWVDPTTGVYRKAELHIVGKDGGLISKNDFVQTIKS